MKPCENPLRWVVLSLILQMRNCSSAKSSKLPKVAEPVVDAGLKLQPPSSYPYSVPSRVDLNSREIREGAKAPK